MPERFNWVCAGVFAQLEPLPPSKLLVDLVSATTDGAGVLREAMRLDYVSGETEIADWTDGVSGGLLELGPTKLIFGYFSIDPEWGRSPNVSISASDEVIRITLSSEIEPIQRGVVSDLQVLASFSEFASTVFDEFILASGPELELPEAGGADPIERLAEAVTGDSRCWSALRYQSFASRKIGFSFRSGRS